MSGQAGCLTVLVDDGVIEGYLTFQLTLSRGGDITYTGKLEQVRSWDGKTPAFELVFEGDGSWDVRDKNMLLSLQVLQVTDYFIPDETIPVEATNLIEAELRSMVPFASRSRIMFQEREPSKRQFDVEYRVFGRARTMECRQA